MKKSFFYVRGVEAKSIIDPETKAKRYFVEGHIDSSDLDLVNDIVTKECMDNIETQFNGRSIKLDFDHETLRAAKGESEDEIRLNLTKVPLGKAIKNLLDNVGNFIKFELNPNWKKFDAKGNIVMTFEELWKSIKGGFFDAFSIAYVPMKTTLAMTKGVEVRLLDLINIINVALTGNPINPGATMSQAFTKSLNSLNENEDKSDYKGILTTVAEAVAEAKSLVELKQNT